MDSSLNVDSSKDHLSPKNSAPTTKRTLEAEDSSEPHDSKRSRQDSTDTPQTRNISGGRSSKSLGRGDYFRTNPDKRRRNEYEQLKRADGRSTPIWHTSQFSVDEIQNEIKRPKRKVAVMIGYSGSGYKGMQIMHDQKTIEGDLFQAFVAAGAISKANADDPKKSALVRCARTDKGVHAAGNVISLKLIIEDTDILEKINSHLPPQIRVWGIQRTTGSFSCYTACDSRWYEYLIPSYAFLPPHPSTWLAKRVEEFAKEDGMLEGISERQEDVANFWMETEEQYIRPILEQLDPQTREVAEQALYKTDKITLVDVSDDEGEIDDDNPKIDVAPSIEPDAPKESNSIEEESARLANEIDPTNTALELAIKSLKSAYVTAKKAYRINPVRLQRIQELLLKFTGTQNFHNYTIKKNPNDPSVKRHIKSFDINPEPVIINNTEWLSIKVHGQSFMMHQIRKMIAMTALMIRCGTPFERIDESLSKEIFNIPKAPSLGLLLERPVFEFWNKKASDFEKEEIDFAKYEKEMQEFKQREIYNKIFEDEENEHVFHNFFNQIDNYRDPTFLFLTTRGISACQGSKRPSSSKTNFDSRRKRRTEHRRENKIGDGSKAQEEAKSTTSDSAL